MLYNEVLWRSKNFYGRVLTCTRTNDSIYIAPYLNSQFFLARTTRSALLLSFVAINVFRQTLIGWLVGLVGWLVHNPHEDFSRALMTNDIHQLKLRDEDKIRCVMWSNVFGVVTICLVYLRKRSAESCLRTTHQQLL